MDPSSWALGIAAIAVIAVMAWDLFGAAGPRHRAPRAP
jgi:hypothetical protein